MLTRQAIRHKLASMVPNRFARMRLRNLTCCCEFAVVSNNCWGAHIYATAGIPYLTPFVGIALTPDAYLTLLKNWEVLRSSLTFRETSMDDSIERMRQERGTLWPVGILGGEVEIQFMHETSRETALQKWQRRLQRMPADRSRLFLKFDDLDGVTEEQALLFDRLDFPHKVFFSANEQLASKLRSGVYIPTRHGKLPDGWTLSKISPMYFDAAAWIAGRTQLAHHWFSLV